MIRTKDGIALSPEEAFICDLEVDDDTILEIPLSTVPELIEVVSRNVAVMRGVYEVVQSGWCDGSEVITDAVLEESKNRIIDTGVVLAHLRRTVDDQLPDQTV